MLNDINSYRMLNNDSMPARNVLTNEWINEWVNDEHMLSHKRKLDAEYRYMSSPPKYHLLLTHRLKLEWQCDDNTWFYNYVSVISSINTLSNHTFTYYMYLYICMRLMWFIYIYILQLWQLNEHSIPLSQLFRYSMECSMQIQWAQIYVNIY